MQFDTILPLVALFTALVGLSTAIVNLMGAYGKNDPEGDRSKRRRWLIPASVATALGAVLLAGYLVVFEFESQLELRDPMSFDGSRPYYFARVYPDRPTLFEQSALTDVIQGTRCTFDLVSPNAASMTNDRYRGAVEAAIRRGVRVRIVTLAANSEAMRMFANAQQRDLQAEQARLLDNQRQFSQMATTRSQQGSLEHRPSSIQLLWSGWVRDVGCAHEEAEPTSHLSFFTYTRSEGSSPVEISVRFGVAGGGVTRSVQDEFDHLWQRLSESTTMSPPTDVVLSASEGA